MPSYDLVFRDLLLFDGSGEAPRRGDLAVAGGVIAAVGRAEGQAREEVAGAGLALAPGFIDTHTHDDRALLEGDMAPKLSQGVTTVVVGNCGISLAPLVALADPPPPLDLLGGRAAYRFPSFADYAEALASAGAPCNALALVGHSTLRVGAMEGLDRPATAAERRTMRERLARALDEGAGGLSTGLDYAPARSAPAEEVMALAEELAPRGALHTTHIRDESEEMPAALDEAFAIGRRAGVPVVLSHFKAYGRPQHGRAAALLEQFDAAAARQPLALDAYPYVASSTILTPDELPDATRVLVTWSKPHPEAAGRELAEIARDWGLDEVAAARRLLPAGAVYFCMSEADVRRILQHPETMIGSDGLPHDAHPHPRLWGAFPRVLGHYARDQKLFSQAEAVRRMTALPAARFRLEGRGRLAEGCIADLVLFDPATVVDRATFERPQQAAAGIHGVWVNGAAAWREGRPTGTRAGRLVGPARGSAVTAGASSR